MKESDRFRQYFQVCLKIQYGTWHIISLLGVNPLQESFEHGHLFVNSTITKTLLDIPVFQFVHVFNRDFVRLDMWVGFCDMLKSLSVLLFCLVIPVLLTTALIKKPSYHLLHVLFLYLFRCGFFVFISAKSLIHHTFQFCCSRHRIGKRAFCKSLFYCLLEVCDSSVDVIIGKRHIAHHMSSPMLRFAQVIIPFTRICVSTSDECNLRLLGVPSYSYSDLSVGFDKWSNRKINLNHSRSSYSFNLCFTEVKSVIVYKDIMNKWAFQLVPPLRRTQ